MFVHEAAVGAGLTQLAGEQFSSVAQVPRHATSLPRLRCAFSTSIKSCQFSRLPGCSAETMSKAVLGSGVSARCLGSLTLWVATKEPSSDISIPVLDVKHQAGPHWLYLLLPGLLSPFCLLYFKQNMEKLRTSLEDLRALFPPCISSPVCVDLALALRWVRWACSDRQTWAENGPGCHSGRRSRSAAFRRRRKSAASSLGTGHVPASCPWKKTHQTGPLKEERWLGAANTGGTSKCGARRSFHADGTPNHIRCLLCILKGGGQGTNPCLQSTYQLLHRPADGGSCPRTSASSLSAGGSGGDGGDALAPAACAPRSTRRGAWREGAAE